MTASFNDDQITQLTEGILRAGEFRPATFEEAFASFKETADAMGGTPEQLADVVGAAFMVGITSLVGTFTQVCMANTDMLAFIMDQCTPETDNTPIGCEMRESADIVARMCAELWACEQRGRASVIEQVNAEVEAGLTDLLTYGEGEA